jgi:hypothetical protein
VDTPKPGDFPIGSVESRAAMRLQLLNEGNAPLLTEIISHVLRPRRGGGPEPRDWNKAPRVGPWQDCGDRLMRILYVPAGMTADEARKILDRAN